MSLSLAHQWLSEQSGLGRTLCLILDSVNAQQARQSLLKTRQPDQYLNLYRETAVADLADIGPCIFVFDNPEEKPIRELLTNPERNWGWLASIRKGDLPLMNKHWQQRLIIGTRPNLALYRFHDNRVLARGLALLNPVQYPAYLGPAISVCYWENDRWAIKHNPDPGEHPQPKAPQWLDPPVGEDADLKILLLNTHRYLLAQHLEAYARLADDLDPQAWLNAQVYRAEAWGWTAPEQLAFLLIQSLNAPAYLLPSHWEPRTDESSTAHFGRLFEEATFWQGNTPI